ncbi:MAG: hypothetical protein ACWA5T_09235 [Parvularcula sp.]
MGLRQRSEAASGRSFSIDRKDKRPAFFWRHIIEGPGNGESLHEYSKKNDHEDKSHYQKGNNQSHEEKSDNDILRHGQSAPDNHKGYDKTDPKSSDQKDGDEVCSCEKSGDESHYQKSCP